MSSSTFVFTLFLLLMSNRINKYIQNTTIRKKTKGQIVPKSWYPVNRAGFTKSIHKQFSDYTLTEADIQSGNLDQTASTKSGNIELKDYQLFVRDYMQSSSPSRGLLIYHSVGTGKSCTSIAATELLLNNREVTVMLPASIRTNYIQQIQKCGHDYYTTQQYWKFMTMDDLKVRQDDGRLDLSILEGVISPKVLKKNKGLWYAVQSTSQNTKDRSPNFNQQSPKAQKQIQRQIQDIIENKYNFLHYNAGVALKRNIEELKKKANGGNPFDNQVIIIDEVHNFITTVYNTESKDANTSSTSDDPDKQKQAKVLYQLLFDAKNCKIMALSGTPIKNNVFEVALLLNLLRGYMTVYSLTTQSNLDNQGIVDRIEKRLKKHPHVMEYQMNLLKNRVEVRLTPFNFITTTANTNISDSRKISYSGDGLTDEQILQDLLRILNMVINTGSNSKLNSGLRFSDNIKEGKFTALPADPEVFNKLFVDSENQKVMNPQMLSRRILGLVSHRDINKNNPDFPRVKNHQVFVDLSPHQTSNYIDLRHRELKLEKSNRFKQSTGAGGNQPSYYKSLTRKTSIFSFPDDIVRPYKSQKQTFLKEIQSNSNSNSNSNSDSKNGDSNGDSNGSNTSTIVVTKRMTEQQYQKALTRAVEKVVKKADIYLVKDLYKYSPKMATMVSKINETPGNVLIYSQFRNTEGIELVREVLNAHGWAELKVQREAGSYKLNIRKEDYHKPKYAEFIGDKDISEILIAIFNNQWTHDSIPDQIRRKLPKLGGLDNLHGSVVKAMLITQSGAEGIDLKNVRQVHILEPFWNQVRIDQVIGRGARMGSHSALPSSERTVDTYLYISKFAKKDLQTNDSKVKNMDDGKTVDQMILEGAEQKAKINNQMLDLMKSASVDCHLFKANHPGIQCYSFPVDLNDSTVTTYADIDKNDLNTMIKEMHKQTVLKIEKEVTIKGVKYLLTDESGLQNVRRSVDTGEKLIGQLFNKDIYLKHRDLEEAFSGILLKTKEGKIIFRAKKGARSRS